MWMILWAACESAPETCDGEHAYGTVWEVDRCGNTCSCDGGCTDLACVDPDTDPGDTDAP